MKTNIALSVISKFSKLSSKTKVLIIASLGVVGLLLASITIVVGYFVIQIGTSIWTQTTQYAATKEFDVINDPSKVVDMAINQVNQVSQNIIYGNCLQIFSSFADLDSVLQRPLVETFDQIKERCFSVESKSKQDV